ncbi:MAG: MFS transporter [Thermoleophilia bacterium]|nr:MFS transporter [Thermoleophilia bacterium]
MRRLLFLACAVVFLDVTFFAVLTPLLPSYQSDLGVGDGAAGLLSASYAAGTLVMALPAGWLAARVGPRRTLIAGLVGIGVFSPLFGFAEHLVLLDASRFLQGASGALMWAGALSWVVSAAPREQRGQVLGTVISAAVVGELLGSPLGAIAHEVGTEIVFSSVTFFAIGLMALALTIPQVAEVDGQPVREAIAAFRGSNVLRGMVMLAGPSVAFGLMVVVAPLRMDDLGASPFLIAAAFASGSVIEAIAGPLIGRYSDRVGRTAPFLFGIEVIIAGVIAMGVFNVLWVQAAAVVAVAFGAGLSFTPASTLVTDAATSAGINQGYASGASEVAWGGGHMVGSAGAGLLAGLSGYLLPSLLVALLLVGVTAVARRTIQTLPTESLAPAAEEFK